ncbi:hypothetical protein [Oryzobacter terrae]|uniref:hypothetical protein n=1 Tax=Oryzobacter terrae TaxID=1620385 RepID=UPI00366F93D4
MSSSLRERLSAGLTPAMKARDRVAVAALRSALAAVSNAEAVPVDTVPRAGAVEDAAVGAGAADAPRRELSEDDVRAVVVVEVDERVRAAAEMAGHGRLEDAQRLTAEADVLRRVLFSD